MLRRFLSSTPKRPQLAPSTFSKTRRTYAVESGRQTQEEQNAAAFQKRLAGHAETAIRTGKGFVKLTAIASVAVGLTIYGTYELTHQYVETKGMKAEHDEEVRKYQWDVSGELWQGDASAGGTDPGLGREGRKAVRAAWMAIHWGVESPELQLSPVARVAEASTLYAIQYLRTALKIAQDVDPSHLHPLTIPQLHVTIAGLYDRLGRAFSTNAKVHYKQAWLGFSGQGLRAAHIALKLGDASSRLEQSEEALRWWGTAIRLCEDGEKDSNTLDPRSLLPTEIPTSPWAQRIVASTLVSLSAFYAQSGRLQEAEEFEESALSFLRSIPTSDSIAGASSPQALHALFLLQRTSLLSIHLAEVLHARKKPVFESIQHLTMAAASSERVARALAGLPVEQSIRPLISEAPLPQGEHQVSSSFSSADRLEPVAARLYQDSTRTSAEAWNLLGVLYEKHEGLSSKTGLLCRERASGWVGEAGKKETTGEADWSDFWANYEKPKGKEDVGEVQKSRWWRFW